MGSCAVLVDFHEVGSLLSVTAIRAAEKVNGTHTHTGALCTFFKDTS